MPSGCAVQRARRKLYWSLESEGRGHAKERPVSTLERAIAIAARAHAGPIDKAGEHYILHPLHVMISVATDLERIVAVLHAVIEDSDLTLEDLRAEGFPEDALAAIDALSK